MKWVARMAKRFCNLIGCDIPQPPKSSHEIEGKIREAQQMVRSTASLVSRRASENAQQAKEITERVRGLTESMDQAYLAAQELVELIRDNDHNQQERRG